MANVENAKYFDRGRNGTVTSFCMQPGEARRAPRPIDAHFRASNESHEPSRLTSDTEFSLSKFLQEPF